MYTQTLITFLFEWDCNHVTALLNIHVILLSHVMMMLSHQRHPGHSVLLRHQSPLQRRRVSPDVSCSFLDLQPAPVTIELANGLVYLLGGPKISPITT